MSPGLVKNVMTSKQRDSYLKAKYGIGVKEYRRMLNAQHGKCAVCKKPPKNKNRSMSVDHDHKTGEVRGLLCYFCNYKVIGRNDPESIKKLVLYILPEYDIIKSADKDTHIQDMLESPTKCDCLICVRREVNNDNKLLKPEAYRPYTKPSCVF